MSFWKDKFYYYCLDQHNKYMKLENKLDVKWSQIKIYNSLIVCTTFKIKMGLKIQSFIIIFILVYD